MSTLHVICRIGDCDYAVSADQVVQMEAYTGATSVPGTPPFVAGIVQIRQQIVPVIDMRARFGLPLKEFCLDSRVMVLKLGDRLVGLIVDSAREVQNISPEQFKAPPDVIATQSTGFVQSIAQLKDRIIMLLDTPKIVGEEVSHA